MDHHNSLSILVGMVPSTFKFYITNFWEIAKLTLRFLLAAGNISNLVEQSQIKQTSEHFCLTERENVQGKALYRGKNPALFWLEHAYAFDTGTELGSS